MRAPGWGDLAPMDLALAHFLNQLGHGVIDPFTDLVCAVPLLVALWLALVLLALRLDRQSGRLVAATVLLAVAIHFLISEALLKHLVLARSCRCASVPYLAHPDLIEPVGHRFTDSSFPSSHAASTAAIVTVLGHAYRRFAAVGALFALVHAASRVHNGMHYPSDVLTGSLLGVGYGALWRIWARRRSPGVAAPRGGRAGWRPASSYREAASANQEALPPTSFPSRRQAFPPAGRLSLPPPENLARRARPR